MDANDGWIGRSTGLVKFAMHVGRFAEPAQIAEPATTRLMTAPTAASGNPPNKAGDLDGLVWKMVREVTGWRA